MLILNYANKKIMSLEGDAMNRRDFLKGVVAIPVAAMIPEKLIAQDGVGQPENIDQDPMHKMREVLREYFETRPITFDTNQFPDSVDLKVFFLEQFVDKYTGFVDRLEKDEDLQDLSPLSSLKDIVLEKSAFLLKDMIGEVEGELATIDKASPLPLQIRNIVEDIFRSRNSPFGSYSDEVLYNRDAGLHEVLLSNRLNCSSGTELFLSLSSETMSLQDFESMAVIYTDGHVLPGYIESNGDVVGLEMTQSFSSDDDWPRFDKSNTGDYMAYKVFRAVDVLFYLKTGQIPTELLSFRSEDYPVNEFELHGMSEEETDGIGDRSISNLGFGDSVVSPGDIMRVKDLPWSDIRGGVSGSQGSGPNTYDRFESHEEYKQWSNYSGTGQ